MPEVRCPKVQAKIDKAQRLLDGGRCWCECVNDDIPNAERLLGEGMCLGANSVISAALRRCDTEGPQPLAVPRFEPVSLPDLPRVSLPEVNL